MAASQPYQPLLLRLLHGFTGIFLIGSLLTAYWTYDTYDGRWGKIPLPHFPEIEGIHGTFGLWTLLIFPAFVVYAFQRGQRRLVQPNSFAKLAQIGKPVWWYTLNRLANTVTLLALTFAIYSGKMMDETWLPQGELNHAWYYAHLISWLVMVAAIALHILLNAKVGGRPLLVSILNLHFRDKDSPALWSSHLSQWWHERRQHHWLHGLQPVTILSLMEIAILVSIAFAWFIPLIPD